jgi:hypothetical protein
MSADDKTQHLRQEVTFKNENVFYTRNTPPTKPRTQNISLVGQLRRRGVSEGMHLMREVYFRLKAAGRFSESMTIVQQHRLVMKEIGKRPDRQGRYARDYSYASFYQVVRYKG